MSSDDTKDVFEKFGIAERQQTPLKVELAVLLHNRIVTNHATDNEALLGETFEDAEKKK